MPASSQSQRGLIFGKRNKYGSKEKTPKKWKWIWLKDYENKGKLPDKVKESRIVNFNTFMNESHRDNYDYTQMLEDCEWIKNKFHDYKEFSDFFKNIDEELYPEHRMSDMGFGFCNNSESSYQPIMLDIAQYLIKNDFIFDIDELENNYKILYFENNIHKFRKYMESQIDRDGAKKYYYYKTIKKIVWGNNKYTEEEKIQYIKEKFVKNKISDKYDISVNSPVSFIEVRITEK